MACSVACGKLSGLKEGQVIELGFEIKGYPGSHRRVELEGNLSQVDRPDLVQGAFMGDAVVRFDAVDFSTHFGWVTLLDWCLRLAVAIRNLAATGSARFTFSESDDFMSFRRVGDELQVTCSYVAEVGVIGHEEELTVAVSDFIDSHLEWISREFPEAMNNPVMVDVYSRLGRPLPAQNDS